jgi:hypothetical protein
MKVPNNVLGAGNFLVDMRPDRANNSHMRMKHINDAMDMMMNFVLTFTASSLDPGNRHGVAGCPWSSVVIVR